MSGVAEGGVQVAKGFMDSLKDQPLSLALCVMNFALIGYVFYESKQFNALRETNVRIFVEQQSKVNDLLSKCIVPPQPGNRTGFQLPLPYKLDLIDSPSGVGHN
jgi:hypothetical protein